MKKYIYVGLFTLVCAALLSVFILKKMEKITLLDVHRAVPGDALLFAENIDYEFLSGNFLLDNRIWVDLVNTSGRASHDSTTRHIIMKVREAEALQDILLGQGLSLSLHLQGKGQLVPLLYIPYGDKLSDHEFEELMYSFLGENALANSRKYEAESMIDISGSPESVAGKFTFSCVNGICLISTSSLIVESAIRTIHDQDDPEADQGLEKIRATAGRYVHANIYVNYKRFPAFLQAFLLEDHWSSFEQSAELAAWGELDLDIKDEAIMLNGMTNPGGASFLGLFRNQSPVKMELHEIIPSGASYFQHFGISDKQAFRSGIEALLESRDELAPLRERGEELLQTYGLNPLEDLLKILDDEIVRFAIEGETTETGDEVSIIETRSRSETVDVVMRWLGQYLQVHTFDMSSYRSVYKLDKQTSFNIYRMPDFYEDEPPVQRIFNKYFTVFENYLIFGPSVEVLSRVIYKNVLHKTFESDPNFKEMSDYFSMRSNVSLFFRPYAFLDYRSKILNSKSQELLEDTELFLRRIPGLVIQYSSEGNLMYQSVSFSYASQIKERALTVWESLLDTSALTKPALVLNHNTREKEIFIQDASDKIYLINSTGRILWSQKVDGRLMGEVYQVDFYKNGKLQFLFNTHEKLYLIDRNGNNVERYPVTLRSEATGPLALFDYDKSRDYRIFIPGVDRKIYAYDIEGNLVTGWKFSKSESRVSKPLQHFRINGKDYIVFSDKSRSYFLDRRGRERVKSRERVVFSESNAFWLDMNIRNENPRWISTDTSGNAICIYLDGTVSRLLERKSPADHFFRMEDMDRDGIPELIYAEDDELNIINLEGKRIFSYKVRDKISMMPDIYKFSSSDLKIGITDHERNRIYLINGDGSLYEGFPLEGSTRFSIGYFAGSDSRFSLIVGSYNNFLYNYSIE